MKATKCSRIYFNMWPRYRLPGLGCCCATWLNGMVIALLPAHQHILLGAC
ncbi:maker325, partial [Drosophila busckii]